MRLTINIPTTLGPRTLIVQGQDTASAHAIRDAMNERGLFAEVSLDGPRFNLKHFLDQKKKREAKAKKRKANGAAENVVQLRKGIK